MLTLRCHGLMEPLTPRAFFFLAQDGGLGTSKSYMDYNKICHIKKQIKTVLLWGNIQRGELSVSCRVCKRYHLWGGCALPTDRLPQGKSW